MQTTLLLRLLRWVRRVEWRSCRQASYAKCIRLRCIQCTVELVANWSKINILINHCHGILDRVRIRADKALVFQSFLETPYFEFRTTSNNTFAQSVIKELNYLISQHPNIQADLSFVYFNNNKYILVVCLSTYDE